MQDIIHLYWESYWLITENPNLTTDKIPNNLLEVWLSDDAAFGGDDDQQTFATAVFEIVIEDQMERKGETIPPDDKTLRYRFGMFQYILALEFINRQLPIKLRPVYIFDFKSYGTPLIFDLKQRDVAKFIELAETLKPLKRKLYQSSTSYKPFYVT